MTVQIIENESFIKNTDFENNEVWILNRTNTDPLDERIINYKEITESFETSAKKFPALLMQIFQVHNLESLDYELITDDKEKFAVKIYVCEESKIKEV